MDLGLKEDIVISQVGRLLQNPSLALKRFSLHSDASLPAELVDNAAMLTTPLFCGMQSGLFVEHGGKLIHKAETKGGRLLLDGQAVAL